MKKDNGFRPISDYGVIGNTRTMALINREAGIDWLCAPNFDSPPCFYPILDHAHGGYCTIEAPGMESAERRYVEDTAVLENVFKSSAGRFIVTDFMPVLEDGFAGTKTGLVQIARIVRCLEGEVPITMRIWPAKGFIHQHKGTDPVLDDEHARYALTDRELMVEAMGCRVSLNGRETHLAARLKAGELCTVLLTFSQPPDLTRHDVEDVLWLQERTTQYWKTWTNQLHYDGPYRGTVVRSAITLKLCQFSPTGAIVAAPTTSLPERLGAEFNWDYRYTWLRDATFTLIALLSLDLVDEAFQFIKFLHATHLKLKEFPTLFTIFGDHTLPEITLHHLTGHAGSKPVRVGNLAADQLQLDIYGELIHCIDLLLSHTQLESSRFSFKRDLWPVIQYVLNTVCEKWREPDKSIWETRCPPRRFVYSQGMCWMAMERGIEITERHNDPVPQRWRETLNEIRKEFHEHAFSQTQLSYVQAYGHADLDASVLRLTLLGLLHPRDHRVRNTLKAIERELMKDGFVLRNKNLDGGAAGEGAFLPCSFWYADNLILAGQIDRGRDLFERLLRCSNDLGLYSEEYEPDPGMMLGNFPQAFTHVSLINSAVQLAISTRGHVSESHNIVRGRRQKEPLAS